MTACLLDNAPVIRKWFGTSLARTQCPGNCKVRSGVRTRKAARATPHESRFTRARPAERNAKIVDLDSVVDTHTHLCTSSVYLNYYHCPSSSGIWQQLPIPSGVGDAGLHPSGHSWDPPVSSRPLPSRIGGVASVATFFLLLPHLDITIQKRKARASRGYLITVPGRFVVVHVRLFSDPVSTWNRGPGDEMI